jgi:hypothetical protein
VIPLDIAATASDYRRGCNRVGLVARLGAGANPVRDPQFARTGNEFDAGSLCRSQPAAQTVSGQCDPARVDHTAGEGHRGGWSAYGAQALGVLEGRVTSASPACVNRMWFDGMAPANNPPVACCGLKGRSSEILGGLCLSAVRHPPPGGFLIPRPPWSATASPAAGGAGTWTWSRRKPSPASAGLSPQAPSVGLRPAATTGAGLTPSTCLMRLRWG